MGVKNFLLESFTVVMIYTVARRIPEEVQKKIVTLRKSGLSLREIAERVGFTRQAASLVIDRRLGIKAARQLGVNYGGASAARERWKKPDARKHHSDAMKAFWDDIRKLKEARLASAPNEDLRA